MLDVKNTQYVRTQLKPFSVQKNLNFDYSQNLEDAYCAMARVINSDKSYGAAWKLGGTTFVTQNIFNVSSAYFGALHKSEVFVNPTEKIHTSLCEYKGEAEIALKLSDSVIISEDTIDQYSDEELFDKVALSIEMPASTISNMAKKGVATLVADRCAAGALIIGQEKSYSLDMMKDFSKEISILQDNKKIAHGSVNNLVRSPEYCVREFLHIALRYGFSPTSGSWIATGGITQCIPLEFHKKIQLLCNNNIYLEFSFDGENNG